MLTVIFAHEVLIVGRICNKFEKNRSFYDKGMKLGTWLVDDNTKKIKGQCHAENVPMHMAAILFFAKWPPFSIY